MKIAIYFLLSKIISQYYNLNIVKLCKRLTVCRMFLKTVTKETSVSYIDTMFTKVN